MAHNRIGVLPRPPMRLEWKSSSCAWLRILGAELSVSVGNKRQVVVNHFFLATEPPLYEVTVHADAFDFLDLLENLRSVGAALVKGVAATVEANLLRDGHEHGIVLGTTEVTG